MSPTDYLALFVKPPLPGRVKTRLASSIGADAACRIYCRMVDHALVQINTSGLPLALCYDGDDSAAIPQPWRKHAMLVRPQRGDTLGERMAETFLGLFAEGVQRVLLMGSDIPGIDGAYLRDACQKLMSHQSVISPALDGGYGLIGFDRAAYTPALFQDIPWSSDQVFSRTLAVYAQVGISPTILPMVRDVDTVDDLRHYPAIFTEGDFYSCPKH